jgi:hypothetical protein
MRDKDYVHEPDARWLYLIGRIRPGTALAPLQQKLSAQLKLGTPSPRWLRSKRGDAMIDS